MYEGAVFTRISSTPTTGDAKASAPGRNSVTTVDPSVVITGRASAEAYSDTSSVYTFEVLGDRSETIAVRYTGHGDAPVAYELELVDDSTSSALGTPDWISSAGEAEEIWTVASPGAYSLSIQGYFRRLRGRHAVRGRQRLRGRLVAGRVRYEHHRRS